MEDSTEIWNGSDMPSLHGRVAIVTGANSGIGLATARALASSDAQVILACRSPQRATTALASIGAGLRANVLPMTLDLADLVSVRNFTAEFGRRFDRLDLLINNAGVMMPPRSETAQGFELQFGVNHLGHFALTGLLLPHLVDSSAARVVNVSSQAHRQGHIDFDDLDWRKRPYSRMAAYAQSKLANLLFTWELARRLEVAEIEVTVAAAHPGWTDTALARHVPFARLLNPLIAMRPAQGALPTLRAAVDPDVRPRDYFGPHGLLEMCGYPVRLEPAKTARDSAVAHRLWEVSIERSGAHYGILQRR